MGERGQAAVMDAMQPFLGKKSLGKRKENANAFSKRKSLGKRSSLRNDAFGQAAVMDAMFFLVISATLCIFLFVFANSYGYDVKQMLQRQQFEEYSTGALKTLLYSSTPRHPGENLLDAKEVDFFLAGAKEDYADDEAFDETALLILKDVNSVLLPLSDSFDYLFYIFAPDKASFPFVLFYKSEWEEPATGRYISVSPRGHRFYFCDIKSMSQIDSLLVGLSNVSRSASKMRLLKLERKVLAEGIGFEPKSFAAEMYLAIWPSEKINETVFGGMKCCDAFSQSCRKELFGPKTTQQAAAKP